MLDAVKHSGRLPASLRPQFHKHRGAICQGVEIRVTDFATLRPYRSGVEVLAAIRKVAPEALTWRKEPDEVVSERPALDLLAGDTALRELLEAGREPDSWCETWAADEEAFREERSEALLYPQRRLASG